MRPRQAGLSGYPEYLPAQRVVEQHVLDTLRTTFELHGFASLETRAVEPLDQLLRKGEIDKEVYVVRRLHAGDEPTTTDDLALHYDLTVPFARYVLEHAGHLEFPFRRYQIQKAWRGERPQEGRYREFCQADVDVVDRDRLASHHEVEVAQVMADALGRLPLPTLTMQVNNRKLLEGFVRGLGADPAGTTGVLRALDRLDKVPADAVRAELVDVAGLSAPQADACLALAAVRGDGARIAEDVGRLGVDDPLLDEGLAELVAVLDGTAGLTGPRLRVVADLRIARGLDYYTGTVYETRMAGYESLGSVCSGGRYDALASDGRTTYPGVGLSFGVTRALAPLLGRGVLAGSRPSPSCVLVAVPDEESRPRCAEVATALRGRGIPCEVSPTAARFGKQIRFAERRGIPWVWFPGRAGGADSVKDIRSGDQVEAVADAWRPPAADLRASVLADQGG